MIIVLGLVIAVAAIAAGVADGLGVGLVSAGAWRSTRRGLATRRELRRSRKEIAATLRDLAETEGSPAKRPASRPAAPAWSMSKLLRKPRKRSATVK